MTLSVETGAGSSTSDSYLSLVDAAAFHTKMGNAAWAAAASDAVREVALLHATRYLDATFGARWQGYRAKSTQALDWPRYGVCSRDGYLIDGASVPAAVRNACAEMALRSLAGDIFADVTAGVVASESVSVGSLSTSKVYVGGKKPTTTYRIVDAILAELLTGGPGNVEVTRS